MKIIINEQQQDKLIKEYLDKEYMKPLYDYLKDGQKYSQGGWYSPSKRMVIPFFEWVVNNLDDDEIRNFSKALNNCKQLQGKIKISYVYDKPTIACYSNTKIGLKQVPTREFLRQNESRLFTITYNDNNLALYWDKFMSFVNGMEGKQQLKKGKYLEADTVLMNPEIMKPQWLIHFTYKKEDALDICMNGFKYGLEPNQMKQLGYTNTDLNDKTKHIDKETKKGKYMYAYNAEEIADGFFPSDLQIPREQWAYDNRFDQKAWENAIHFVVMFTSSGVEVRHDTDNQQQVIFNADMAHNFVLISFKQTEDRKRLWLVNTTSGKSVYGNESLTKVITWVMNNYPQYRKQICFKK